MRRQLLYNTSTLVVVVSLCMCTQLSVAKCDGLADAILGGISSSLCCGKSTQLKKNVVCNRQAVSIFFPHIRSILTYCSPAVIVSFIDWNTISSHGKHSETCTTMILPSIESQGDDSRSLTHKSQPVKNSYYNIRISYMRTWIILIKH